MTQYIGYRLRVTMQNDVLYEGTIVFVDNLILKMRNVKTNDIKRGIIKELIIKACDIKDLAVIEYDPQFQDDSSQSTPREDNKNTEPHSTAPISSLPPTSLNSSENKNRYEQSLTNGVPNDHDQTNNEDEGHQKNVKPNKTKKLPMKSPSKRNASMRELKDTSTFGQTEENYDEDFDFVGNNQKFNKQQVFAEMISQKSSEMEDIEHPAASDIPKILFKSDGGVIPAITAVDANKICEITGTMGPNQYQIAENAGRSMAQLAFKYLKERKKTNGKVIVLVGVGNKGSCGLCTARHLMNHNINVIVCHSRLYHLPEHLSFQRSIYKGANGKETHIGGLPVEAVDLIIDCLVGCGLRGTPTGPTATLIQWANANGAPIISMDVPTGLDASTGWVRDTCIKPSATLALGLPKTGLLPHRTGELYLADVGIPSAVYAKLGVEYTSPFQEQFILRLHTSNQ